MKTKKGLATTITKTKVNATATAVVVIIAIAIGVSFVVAKFLATTSSSPNAVKEEISESTTGLLAAAFSDEVSDDSKDYGSGDACPSDLKTCPSSSNPQVCCQQQEQCASKWVPGKGTVHYCKPTTDSCPQPPNKLCTAGNQNACCPAGASCDTSGWPSKIAFCSWENTDGSCQAGKVPVNCSQADGDQTNNTFCCNPGETCLIESGVKVCQPTGDPNNNSCDTNAGETFCQGTGDASARKRCCPAGTVCKRHPGNGYPYCYDPPEIDDPK